MSNYFYFLQRRNYYLFWCTTKPKCLIFFPIRRDIRSFPLQALPNLGLHPQWKSTDAVYGQMYLWLRFHRVLCMPKPLILHRTIPIRATQVCSQKQLLHKNHTYPDYSTRVGGKSSFSENLAYRNDLEYFGSSVCFPALWVMQSENLKFQWAKDTSQRESRLCSNIHFYCILTASTT